MQVREQSDSAESSEVPLAPLRAKSSPLINPIDLGPPPTNAVPEPPVFESHLSAQHSLQVADQASPRDISVTPAPAPVSSPTADVSDPPKYIEFSEGFESFKSSHNCQSPPPSVTAVKDTIRVAVSTQSMSAPKPQAVSWVGLAFLGLLAVISSCVLIGLEIGSGMVKWRVKPLRLDVRPVSCEPQAINDGLMVHIDCPIRKLHTFHAPSDFRANLESFDGLFFEMKVEMFQDTILPGSFKSSVKGTWSDHLLPTQRGWSWDNNKNPDFFPHVEGSGRKFGSSLYGGAFRLERPHVIDFHTKKQLSLTEDQVYSPSAERPPTKVTSHNTRLFDNALYTGDPQKPKVGDIRITFYGSSATHLSAIGIQSAPVSSWTRERDLLGFWDPFSKKNATRTIVMEGDYTAKSLLDAFEQENDYCGRYLTIARLVVLTFLCLLFFCIQRLQHHGSSHQASWLINLAGAIMHGSGVLTILIGLCAFMYSALVGVMWVVCGCVLVAVGSICQRAMPRSKEYEPLLMHEEAAAPSPTYITQTVKTGNGGGTASPSASYAAI